LLIGPGYYAPSNPPKWLEKLNLQAFLLSVAAENREGLPNIIIY
jgi:hypothetical protein